VKLTAVVIRNHSSNHYGISEDDRPVYPVVHKDLKLLLGLLLEYFEESNLVTI